MTAPGSPYRSGSSIPVNHSEDKSVPLVTWLIGGITLIVSVTAGALFLSDKQPADKSALSDDDSADLQVAAAEQEKVSLNNPLDLSSAYWDALERAKIWNERAILTSIELVIEEAKPQGAIHFEFADSIGQAIPKLPVGSGRYTVSLSDSGTTVNEEKSSQLRISLAEPNCPLEVAFRKFVDSGSPREARTAALLVHSNKHRRPVWLMSLSDGTTTTIDADSCALLRQ